jgi:hypothetical protein
MQIGSVFTLDAVPFVISDKFRPPAKVTVPMSFEVGNPSEVLFMEYNPNLEEAVLVQSKKAHAAQQAAVQAVLSSSRKDVVTSAENTQAEDIVLPQVFEVNTELTNTMPLLHERSGYVHSPMNGSNILLPTPVIAPVNNSWSSKHVEVGSGSTLPNIDLKDFENEQDPFENLSLCVMDDRAELSKVFHSSESSLRPLATVTQAVNDQIIAATQKSFLTKNGHIHYVDVNDTDDTSSSRLNNVSSRPVQPRWPVGNFEYARTDEASIHTVPGSVVHPLDNLPLNRKITTSSSINYMPDRDVGCVTGPGHLPPQALSYSLPLRSAKSTPDISSLIDEYSASLSSAQRIPSPVNHVEHCHLRTASKMEVQNLPEMHTLGTLPVPGLCSTSLAEPSNIYLSLSLEAKHFVDSISTMGFDKLDIARAVSKLGTDEKLVLDHLCQLAQLKEKGHESYEAAMALFLFDSCTEKAEIYLKLSKNFMELGFSRESIKDALISSNLDEDKSLDLLIGS